MRKNEEQTSLKSLADRTRSGDPKAEALLYRYLSRECYPKIESYIRNRGGMPEDARDLFQDAVLVLLEAIKAQKFVFNPLSLRSYSGQLCAYLMTVARNLWLKELRWRGRDKEDWSEAGEEALSLDLFSALVREAFLALGEECRQLLAFYFKEKLSPRVIAGKTEQTTDEVKKQLSDCVDGLLKDIGRYLDKEHQGKLMEMMREGMDELEERCRTILKRFYFERRSMSELAEQLGYANAHSVTEQKRRCMERLNYAVVNRLMNRKEP
ncbi:MAG: sigma-70 family RNA polymerase sigma factor [Lewinellaceae bacterium]|nr:sigma-70 family RNA polymerase sigma factor [Lewinellaceae bacterium]